MKYKASTATACCITGRTVFSASFMCVLWVSSCLRTVVSNGIWGVQMPSVHPGLVSPYFLGIKRVMHGVLSPLRSTSLTYTGFSLSLMPTYVAT